MNDYTYLCYCDEYGIELPRYELCWSHDYHGYPFRLLCGEDITGNLYDIRDACDAISNLCDMIDELETVDNDANGVICFGSDEEFEE